MFAVRTHHPQKEAVSTQHAIYPTSKLKAYIVLLIASKGIVSFCYFLSYDVLRAIHVVHFLFIIKAVSSILLILIQKPFSTGKMLNKQQWLRIVRHSVLSSLITLVQLFGLCLCGPLRAILLAEHRDVVVVAVAMSLFTGLGGNSKLRGAICFLFGILALIFLDHDEISPLATEHPEGQMHHGISHFFYYSVSWLGLVDHKAGVLLLVCGLCLHAIFSSTTRHLAVDVGGAKRLNALSTFFSALLLAPWAIFLRMYQMPSQVQWSDYFLPFSIISIFMFVTNYYVDAICIAKLDASFSTQVSSLASFTVGLIAGALPPLQNDRRHDLSLGVVLAWFAFVFATLVLTSSPTKKSGRGTFVGYSAEGLPLYTMNGGAIETTSRPFLLSVKSGMRQILEEANSRKIFYFLCLNVVFTIVEMMYGIWTNSLGLISDGFHMMFDCSALVMGLCASLLARKKPSKTFPFGYSRIEVLSGFINGLFLVVVAVIVFKEAFSRLLDPPKILTTRLLAVSVAGLLVNLLGIVVFHHAHHHRHHGGGGHKHSHAGGNANLQGVFLHILADTLGSVGVIISSLLIEHFGLYVADPICSLFISLLILGSVLPLLKHTARVLLLRSPEGLEKSLAITLNKVMQVPGVLSYREPRFWQHSPEIAAGSIHIQVAPSVSEQKTTNQISALFRKLGFVHFSVQVEKEAFYQHMSGLGNDLNNMLRSAQNSLSDTVKTI